MSSVVRMCEEKAFFSGGRGKPALNGVGVVSLAPLRCAQSGMLCWYFKFITPIPQALCTLPTLGDWASCLPGLELSVLSVSKEGLRVIDF